MEACRFVEGVNIFPSLLGGGSGGWGAGWTQEENEDANVVPEAHAPGEGARAFSPAFERLEK